MSGARIIRLPRRDGRHHEADDGPLPEEAERLTHEREDRWVTVLCAAVRPPAVPPSAVRRGAGEVLKRWTLHVVTNLGEVSAGDVVVFGHALEPGFLAEFRGPDHAVRAVRTADWLRRSLALLQRDVSAAERCGVASGIASAGSSDLRLSSGTVRWLGRALPTAIRLQEFAGPGQILLTDATRRALAGRVRALPVGDVAGGHDWGSPAWSLTGLEA